MSLHQYSATIAAIAPFDFAQSLRFIGFFSPMYGEQRVIAGSLSKALQIDERTVVFRVTAGTSPAELIYTLFSAQQLDAEQITTAVDRIRFFLSLDDDLTRFYRIAAADPAFAPVMQQLYGLHQVKFLTPFENACWAILTQRLPIPVARKIKDAFVEAVGGCLEVEGNTYRAFPTAAQVAALDIPTLTILIRNPVKAERIHAAAQAFLTVDERWLRNAPFDQVEAWLRQIPGIGTWSASFILIRGLGRMDRVPTDNTEISKALARRYGAAASLSDLLVRYGDQQGYWSYYMRAAG
ncbi:MAG: DNA-3-methyladenine glycosylase 2 family protein [Anaerolineae bacterium]|nr:DNA-3-methyladenine glycosylase 2 family protein [Anaerolineae bacterium]